MRGETTDKGGEETLRHRPTERIHDKALSPRLDRNDLLRVVRSLKRRVDGLSQKCRLGLALTFLLVASCPRSLRPPLQDASWTQPPPP